MDRDTNAKSRALMIRGIIVYAILFLAVMLMINLDAINTWVADVLRLLRPILIGLVVAYLLNPFFRFFERRLLQKLRPQGFRRTVALILTYLTFFLILALVMLLILPQLIQSIASFASQYNYHITSAIAQFNKLVENVNGLIERFTDRADFFAYLSEENAKKTVMEWLGTSGTAFLDKLSKLDVKPITEVIGSVLSVLTDSLFGLFISLYLLASKEKRHAQIMKLRHALFGNNVNRQISEFCRLADRSFGGFLQGKLLDSLIIGLLTYVVISILQIPYAILIATFVGLTNVVPIIGPIIGAIPTAFILLLTDPSKVIPFLIVIVIIQQLDGNVIGPKILGDNTGVSSLCVVIAIALTGRLWGLIGMILGVPLFATVLELTDRFVVEKLQKKGLPAGLENYYASDATVDSAKKAYSTTDKAVQNLHRRALQIEKKIVLGQALSRKERFLTRIYRVSRKLHIIGDLPDEVQARFAAEDAALAAEALANELAEARRSADTATEEQ